MNKIAIVSTSRADFSYLREFSKRLRWPGQKAFYFPDHVSRDQSNQSFLQRPYAHPPSGFFDGGTVDELSNYHLVCLLGDRFEALILAVLLDQKGVDLCHLNGGDTSLGSRDETYRKCLTLLAKYHLPFSIEGKSKILDLGIESCQIQVLDDLIDSQLASRIPIHSPQIINPISKQVVCAYHPNTLTPGATAQEMQILEKVLKNLSDYNFIWSYPNMDHGNDSVIELLRHYESKYQNVSIMHPSDEDKFLQVCMNSMCVIGNSSAGIIELPRLNIPCLNIGDRQKGRYYGLEVKHCSFDSDSISDHVKKFELNRSFRTIPVKFFEKKFSPIRLSFLDD